MNKKDIIDQIIKQQSLDIFRIACDRKNFSILSETMEKKKINLQYIKKKYNISGMPANRRINMLTSVGLIERVNMKREIVITKLGLKFINIISGIQTYLKTGINKNLENYMLMRVK